MRREIVAEIGGSLIIAAITGLYTVGGLALAAYVLLACYPGLKTSGLMLLLFGVVNLPVFVMWSVETAREISLWTGHLPQNLRDFHPLR